MKKRELGTVVAEFGPSREQNNSRNSEGTFLSTKDGKVIFVYARFRGDTLEDWVPADLCLAESEDGGRTFAAGRTILTCQEEEAVNIMSPSLLAMENGDIGLFYLVRTTYTLMQLFLRRSGDGGKTWGERVLCTPQEGFFVVNNDRVTRLASGRILVPAAVHRTGHLGAAAEAGERQGTAWSRLEQDGRRRFVDERSEVVFFYSDDDGGTWQAAEGKCCMPYMRNCLSGLQEPGVLELEPGILWGFARTDLGRQYEMHSVDNAQTWTGAGPSRFTAPQSPLSMKRDKNGDIYAVWNPIPEYNGREKKTEIFTGGRTPYVIAVSRDNGRTFTEETAFETEEDHGYCYCAMLFLEDGLLLSYNAGGPQDGSCLARTRIRRISREEMETL